VTTYCWPYPDIRVAAKADLADVGVIIPTCNAARHWSALQEGLDHQGLAPSQILIIDSSSSDGTRTLARQAGYRVVCIRKEEFSHGATRQLACSYLADKLYLLFMTQDAVLASADSIEKLFSALDDEDVGAAYGRQIARHEADPIERHGRMFNYPAVSQVRTLKSRQYLGFKTVFFSNSFAIYRRAALEAVGGFPLDAIVSEEVTVVGKMLLAGWKIAYEADAVAVHSHSFTLTQEFARYFDIGVHHGREKWLLAEFGGTGNEGMEYLRSEFRYLLTERPLWIPYAALRLLSKYVAYRLGTHERHLPAVIKQLLSAQQMYWRPRSEGEIVADAGPQPGATDKTAGAVRS